jgi:hypothetical protein
MSFAPRGRGGFGGRGGPGGRGGARGAPRGVGGRGGGRGLYTQFIVSARALLSVAGGAASILFLEINRICPSISEDSES